MRIKPKTHRRLQQLARDSKRSLPDVLDEAISEYERKKFLEGVHEDYARLRADPQAWREELEERALWDVTLMDGLEDEPPYPPEGGLKMLSYIKCEDVRSLSLERFQIRIGHVSDQTLSQVEYRLRVLLLL